MAASTSKRLVHFLLILAIPQACQAFQAYSPPLPLLKKRGLSSQAVPSRPNTPPGDTLLFGTRSALLMVSESNEQSLPPMRRLFQRFMISFRKRQTKWLTKIRELTQSISTLALSLLLVFVLLFGVADASSGYRTGGSFKPSSSSRPPIHRHYSPSRSSQYFRPPPMRAYRPSPWTSVHFHNGPRVVYRSNPGFSVGDAIVLTGAGALIAYGFVQNSRNRNGSNMTSGPLGYGATTTSVTVAVDIPDRNDPNSILNRLQRIAERADTSRREGIQQLVSEATLEILRNANSITSTTVSSKNHRNADLAQRDFNARSVESRTKYDREVNRFGGQNELGRNANSTGSVTSSTPTIGVITLNLAIDGSSTHIPSVKSRPSLLEALKRISADSHVEDCLFAAELLWSPAERDDILSREELYYRYPNLLPV